MQLCTFLDDAKKFWKRRPVPQYATYLCGSSVGLLCLRNLTKIQKHGNIRFFQADVTSKADLSRAVDYVAQESGHVNLVVANSGVTGPSVRGLSTGASLTEFRKHLLDADFNEFNNTFAVNTTAVFYTVVAFLDLLDKGNKAGNVEQRSQVIAVSSAGAYSRVPMAGYAYASSKAAVAHMMKQFATSLAPYGIRSNVLAPGGELKIMLLV